jgi:hypothetical protein
MECYSGVVEELSPWRRSARGLTRVRVGGVVLDPLVCNAALHRELAAGRGVDLFVHRYLLVRRCLVGVRRHDTGDVTAIGTPQVAAWLFPFVILVLVFAFPGMLAGAVASAVVCLGASGTCRDAVAGAVLVAAMLVPVVAGVALVRDVRAVRRLRRRTPEMAPVPFPADT